MKPLWCTSSPITKTYLYNFDPLKPHFYIVKLGFTGYTLFCYFCSKNIDCGYSLEPPRRGGSNEYPQSVLWAEIWKKISEFLSENFQFLVVIFYIYLNRRVFVMDSSLTFKWLFFILIFTIYRQSNLAIKNEEFPQPVLVWHFQRKFSMSSSR